MKITFGDDAFDAFVALAAKIRADYTVALIPANGDVPEGPNLNVDVRFVSANSIGVQYHRFEDEDYDTASSATYTRGWEDIDRIHIY